MNQIEHTNHDNTGQQYAIGIVPVEPVYGKLNQLKESLKEKYKLDTDINSPPFLELVMPFNWDDKKEYILVDCLKKFARQHFSVELDFEGFEKREQNIRLHMPGQEALQKLQLDLKNHLDIHLRLQYHPSEPQPYTASQAIGLDERSKNMIKRAWEELKDMHFSASFIANNFSLLKLNPEGHWQVMATFELE